ncbi:MAG: TetR/AcrR family transcriptional regulator [Caldilineaceae bacterium]
MKLTEEQEGMIEITYPGAVTARPERADAAENRARILATAQQLIAEHGVAAVNMVDIARAAGIGQGTLYRRFANKSELCLALLDRQMRDFQEEVLAHLRTMTAANAGKLTQLAWFIDALVHFQAHHSLLLCAVSREIDVATNPESPPFLWQRLTVQGLLRAALAKGELAADVDTEFVGNALLALLAPEALHTLRETNHHSNTAIVAGIQRLLQGLAVDDTQPQ